MATVGITRVDAIVIRSTTVFFGGVTRKSLFINSVFN